MASPNDLEPAIDAVNPAEAHMIAAVLRENGIEAFVFDTAAQALLGDAQNLISPFMVHVQRKDIERAQSIIRSNRDDSIDLDWDEIDVGEMDDDGCLNAPSTSIAAESPLQIVSSFLPWIMVLLFIILIFTAIK